MVKLDDDRLVQRDKAVFRSCGVPVGKQPLILVELPVRVVVVLESVRGGINSILLGYVEHVV